MASNSQVEEEEPSLRVSEQANLTKKDAGETKDAVAAEILKVKQEAVLLVRQAAHSAQEAAHSAQEAYACMKEMRAMLLQNMPTKLPHCSAMLPLTRSASGKTAMPPCPS